MINSLFVYGTLQPNQSNNYILESIGGSYQKAFIYGEFDSIGWGLTGGYPAVRLSETLNKVEGYLFTSSELQFNLNELDYFEGDRYKRVQVDAITDNGIQKAYIYVLNE